MQAISVPQPWAWAVARGHTTHLNQAADSCYRGPLAIYASFRAETTHVRSQAVREANGDSADPLAAIGGIVAVVSLADVCMAGMASRPCGCGQWALRGSYHWQGADPRPLRLPGPAPGPPRPWGPPPALPGAGARAAGMPRVAGGAE